METLLLIAVIYLFFALRGVKRRLSALEEGSPARIDRVQPEVAREPAPQESAPAEEIPEPTPVPAPQVWARRAPEPEDPPAEKGAKDSSSRKPHEPSIDLVDRGIAWLKDHWFHAMAALSLTLSGIFATQYAAENGLLSPAMRITVAMLFGFALIGAGEWIRRRFGDGAQSVAAYMPSIFSGAGVVTLFGAVLSARSLYDMIGAETAIGGLVMVAAISVILGWFYGPLLAAVGILGATAAPFLVGGDPGAPALLQSYFGLIAVAGMLIHAVRRWPGFDILSMAVPLFAAFTAMVAAGGEAAFMVLITTLIILGPIFGTGSVLARLPGTSLLIGRLVPAAAGKDSSVPPMSLLHLAAWGLTALMLPLAAAEIGSTAGVVLAAGQITFLFWVASKWSRKSKPALDMMAFMVGGLILLAGVVLPEVLKISTGEEAFWPLVAIITNGLIMSVICAKRSWKAKRGMMYAWAMAAAMVGPGLLVLLEILVRPGQLLGVGTWSGVAMGTAALATWLAERAGRHDGEDRLRAALGALVALSMIAMSLFASFEGIALSVALGVLTLAAAALDDRFKLPPISVFVQIGVAVLLYRTVVDPGLIEVVDMAWGSLLLTTFVPLALLSAALLLYKDADRPAARAALEGGVTLISGVTVTAVIVRLVSESGLHESHAVMGLIASSWIAAAWVNLRNAGLARSAETETGEKRRLRVILPQIMRYGSACVSLLMGGIAILAGLTILGPLFGEKISGVPVLSSMVPAYVLPGALLVIAGLRLDFLHRVLRGLAIVPGLGLIALYALLTVAQAWRGPKISNVPMGDGELWTYTALLLVIGASLFLTALSRQSVMLRHAANGVILVAIAKVFLVDAPDLDGLVRAGSFLVLGLCLAGLAWVNRLASSRRSATQIKDL